MKTSYKILLILLLFCTAKVGVGQTDYAIEYSTQDTCISTSISEYDKLLRHIIPDKKEITHLYKIDLIQLARLKLNFGVEQHLTPTISLESGATFHIGQQPYYYAILVGEPTFFEKFSKNSLYYLGLNTSLKYYHNINSRIKRGKNTNGFSGNYLTLGFNLNMAFYDTDLWHVNYTGEIQSGWTNSREPKVERMFQFNEQGNWESMGCINFGYGIQRRIGNVGFWSADAKIGIGTNKFFDTLYIPIELSLKAGFALPSLSRKR